MTSIKYYNSDHYDFFLEKANILIKNYNDVDSWVRNLTDEELVVWLKTLKKLKKNDLEYFQETSIFLTVIIRLFILELDVQTKIKLTNNQILRIIKRFEYVISMEYGYRKRYFNGTNKYTLLKDLKGNN